MGGEGTIGGDDAMAGYDATSLGGGSGVGGLDGFSGLSRADRGEWIDVQGVTDSAGAAGAADYLSDLSIGGDAAFRDARDGVIYFFGECHTVNMDWECGFRGDELAVGTKKGCTFKDSHSFVLF